MTRLGYKCDECGDEFPRHEPAAAVRRHGDWIDLCATCYEDWEHEKEEVKPRVE